MPDRPSHWNADRSRRPGYVFVVPWDLHHAGGVNQVVINLHRRMDEAQALEPIILVNEWSAFRPIEKRVDGRLTIYLRLAPPWSDRGRVGGLLKWALTSPIWIADLLALCRRHRVHAFNIHYPSVGALPVALLRACRLYRGALILSFHGADLQSAVKSEGPDRMMWNFLLRSASAAVACSRALSAELIAIMRPLDVSKVHTIHNGLDIDRFLGEPDRGAVLPEGFTPREFILSVATWEPKKGLDVLIRAYAKARHAASGLALVLVGRPGEAEAALRALVRELGLENDVFFYGNVPHAQVSLLLGRAKLFCLPSRVEPFGIAVLEAGAYRLPVIASRVGGIPEIIIDGESGLLVEPDDADALAAALGRVLGEANLGRDLGQRLYQRVASDFSWRRAYERYFALVPRLSR